MHRSNVFVDDLAFTLIQPRGDEEPDLIDDPRAGEDESGFDGNGEGGDDGFLGLAVAEEVGVTVGHECEPVRAHDHGDDVFHVVKADEDEGDGAEEGVDDAFAEFFEMFAEAHTDLGFFGVAGEGGFEDSVGHKEGDCTRGGCGSTLLGR